MALVLWSSGLHCPQKRKHGKTVHIWLLWGSVYSNSGFPHPNHMMDLLTLAIFQRWARGSMSNGSQQRQMRVAVSAVVVCLRGANPTSTEIFTSITPPSLYSVFTTLILQTLIHQSSSFIHILPTKSHHSLHHFHFHHFQTVNFPLRPIVQSTGGWVVKRLYAVKRRFLKMSCLSLLTAWL